MLSKALKQASTAINKAPASTPSSISQSSPKGISFSCVHSPVESFVEEDVFQEDAATSDDISSSLHDSFTYSQGTSDNEESAMFKRRRAIKNEKKFPSSRSPTTLAIGEKSSRCTFAGQIEAADVQADQPAQDLRIVFTQITPSACPIQISFSWRGPKMSDESSFEEIASPKFQPPHELVAKSYADEGMEQGRSYRPSSVYCSSTKHKSFADKFKSVVFEQTGQVPQTTARGFLENNI
ncbi:hypothetical protein CEUSTIGMA_g8699.t1 [Chlamydomonas eustigma]|uniref:Uncharacterized protein n=1 Tax=Chlamydomonas eustigma TaxID=1157962 RepID=A0A250XDV6_9CHLO|nr:hypothetical protein CEUSTIGMA_g8699.t1 [Chlamydomonas eustigma]|eukprot:GAX81267.1 hypothetical protein CEUSTIGMA_g8699.t1 [Chlamydomonas eustigma]